MDNHKIFKRNVNQMHTVLKKAYDKKTITNDNKILFTHKNYFQFSLMQCNNTFFVRFDLCDLHKWFLEEKGMLEQTSKSIGFIT